MVAGECSALGGFPRGADCGGHVAEIRLPTGRGSGPEGPGSSALEGRDRPAADHTLGDPHLAHLALGGRHHIEAWFVRLAEEIRTKAGSDAKRIVASAASDGDLSLLAKKPVSVKVRIISVHPQCFRGFRNLPQPIVLADDLVVVEGRNSSGARSTLVVGPAASRTLRSLRSLRVGSAWTVIGQLQPIGNT